jgi:hypothetical protein
MPAHFADGRRDCPTLIFAAEEILDLAATDFRYWLRRMARFFSGYALRQVRLTRIAPSWLTTDPRIPDATSLRYWFSAPPDSVVRKH